MVVVEADGMVAAGCLVGADALAVGVSSALDGGFRVERAVAEEGGRALVALLLQALGAHGAEEAMSCQRDVGATCGGGRATLCSQAAGDTGSAGGAVHGAASARRRCLRPSAIASGLRAGKRRGPRGRKARLARGPRDA